MEQLDGATAAGWPVGEARRGQGMCGGEWRGEEESVAVERGQGGKGEAQRGAWGVLCAQRELGESGASERGERGESERRAASGPMRRESAMHLPTLRLRGTRCRVPACKMHVWPEMTHLAWSVGGSGLG